jgi:S1-C subfamily serine protease
VFTQEAVPSKKETFGSGFIVTTDGYVVTNKRTV